MRSQKGDVALLLTLTSVGLMVIAAMAGRWAVKKGPLRSLGTGGCVVCNARIEVEAYLDYRCDATFVGGTDWRIPNAEVKILASDETVIAKGTTAANGLVNFTGIDFPDDESVIYVEIDFGPASPVRTGPVDTPIGGPCRNSYYPRITLRPSDFRPFSSKRVTFRATFGEEPTGTPPPTPAATVTPSPSTTVTPSPVSVSCEVLPQYVGQGERNPFRGQTVFFNLLGEVQPREPIQRLIKKFTLFFDADDDTIPTYEKTYDPPTSGFRHDPNYKPNYKYQTTGIKNVQLKILYDDPISGDEKYSTCGVRLQIDKPPATPIPSPRATATPIVTVTPVQPLRQTKQVGWIYGGKEICWSAWADRKCDLRINTGSDFLPADVGCNAVNQMATLTNTSDTSIRVECKQFVCNGCTGSSVDPNKAECREDFPEYNRQGSTSYGERMLNQGCSLSCTATGISGGRGDGWCEGDPEAPREMDPQMFLKAADVDGNGFVNPDDFFLVARQMALGSYDPTYDICSDGAISPDNVINVLDTSCMLRAIEIQLRNL